MATAPELLSIPEVSLFDRGKRMRLLRRLAEASQGDIAQALGFRRAYASSISKIEAGERKLDDMRARQIANYLVGRGDLCANARVLLDFVIGEHDDLNACVSTRLSSADPRSTKGGYRNPPLALVA